MKKRFLSFYLACVLIFLLPQATFAMGYDLPDNVTTSASAACFINLDTGITVYEHEPNTKRSVASLTKLMTALLLVEQVPDLDGTMWTADPSLYVPPITNSDSSTADIRPYEQVTARSVLYGMMLPSGNEAAEIAAFALGNGNLANFYAMMNARAVELGCTNTSFASAHGLVDMEEGNYSTAADLALIAKACWENEVLRTVFTSTSYEMPATNIHKQPYMIYSSVHTQSPNSAIYRPYFRGMKTGSTFAAGRNYVSAAVNTQGETFVGVVLGCPWEPASDGFAESFHDAISVYDWMFDDFSVQPTLDIETPINEVPVRLSSDTDSVKVYPKETLYTYLPNENADLYLKKSFTLPESVNAPITQGDVVGSVEVFVNGISIGTSDLLAAQTIERTFLLYALDQMHGFFTSTFFKVFCVVTLVYSVGMFGLWLYLKHEMRKRRAERRAKLQQKEQDDT